MDNANLMVTGLKMLVSLGFVLLVFGGALFIVKKFSFGSKGFLKRATKGNLKPLEILTFQSLGPGRSLYLIRCLDKKILIGATNQGVSHIADIDEPLEAQFSSPFESSLDQKISHQPDSKIKGNIESSLRDISRV